MTTKDIEKELKEIKTLFNKKGASEKTLLKLYGKNDCYLELQELDIINKNNVSAILKRDEQYLDNEYLEDKDKAILQSCISELKKVLKTLKE